MYRIHSDRLIRLLPLVIAAGVTFVATPLSAQTAEIVSQQISTSQSAASLRLELSDGRTVDIAMRGGQAYVDGRSIGAAPRQGVLERSFRELLRIISEAEAQAVPSLLKDWQAADASSAATRLDRVLEDAVRGVTLNADASAAAIEAANAEAMAAGGLQATGVPAVDSVEKLNERIEELQSRLEDERRREISANMQLRNSRYDRGPFYSLRHGLAEVFSVLVLYAILFAVAVAVIAFGGRKYIEGVADTARHMTMRSWLVGLAGTFLVIPAFVLGIIALTISIVGIPALLAWVPLFPIAVVLSFALGYLAVAHAAGESLAERRFYVNDWVQRGNSYYFILSGLGLLLAAFVAAGVIHMAGPWLGFIRAILIFLGVVFTWAAFTVGFGAVLVSRAGTRPLGKAPLLDDFVDEGANV